MSSISRFLLDRVDRALQWAVAQLAGTDEASRAAKMLLAHVLGCTLEGILIRPERVLQEEEARAYQSLVARRARHEPVAYLVGHRAFMDLDLIVDQRVLIPRPETELLAEQAIAIAGRWPVVSLADVGTGSGAIAVALAVHLPHSRVFATDVSADALSVARINAARYGVAQRITFLQGDLLSPLPEPVHLIVANLPYISESELERLPSDIRLYEPRRALVAGAEGLDAIGALLAAAGRYLTEEGAILLEIGATQGQKVCRLARQALPGAHVQVIQDYASFDRMVCVALQKKRG